MIKPSTLKILGHEYSINYKPKLYHAERSPANCCVNTLEIEIDSTFKESKQEEGLIHEIIEAINGHLEMELPHEKISQLGENLYQVLNDNNLLR